MFQKILVPCLLEDTSGTSVGVAAERAPVGGHGKPESQRLGLDTDQAHVRREPRSKLDWLFQRRKNWSKRPGELEGMSGKTIGWSRGSSLYWFDQGTLTVVGTATITLPFATPVRKRTSR